MRGRLAGLMPGEGATIAPLIAASPVIVFFYFLDRPKNGEQ